MPDERRKEFIEAVAENAVEIPSADFLTVEAVCDLFTMEERNYILARIRQDALPYLDDAVERWKSDYDTDDDPESHFEDLVGTFDEFKRAFRNDAQAQRWLSSALSDIDDAVDELERDMEERERRRQRDAERDANPIHPIPIGAEGAVGVR